MISKSNIILSIIICVLLFVLYKENNNVIIKEQITRRDSIVRDTVREIITQPRELIIIEQRDTLWLRDTTLIPVYFNQLEYKTDRYKIIIEGYHPKLISVETYPITHFVTIDRVVERNVKKRRITSGINVGAGLLYGTKGIDIGLYIGYGLSVHF